MDGPLDSLGPPPDTVVLDEGCDAVTQRQELVLVALYLARAFDYETRRSVHVLVAKGLLTDSRYAGPLAALADYGLVENRHEILRSNWKGVTDWWLTEEGRVAAQKLW